MQSALVSVEQNREILASEIVTGIDQVGRQCCFDFVYDTLVDPVSLIIQSAVPNQQFNKDNPIVVTDLVLDELFEIPFLQHSFDLICDGEVIDQGNVLYRHGRLVLTLNLPLVSCTKIATRF